jgi:hypothetical protein
MQAEKGRGMNLRGRLFQILLASNALETASQPHSTVLL